MSDWPNRQSVRLRGYDYAGPGSLFFTWCSYERRNFFGAVVDGVMHLNSAGDLVWQEWERTLLLRPELIAHAFVVMPNHLHGLISLAHPPGQEPPALTNEPGRPLHARKRPRSLSSLATGFKGAVTRELRRLTGDPALRVWQRGFHDRVVRNEREFETVLAYIQDNPARWHDDRFNPDRLM